MSLQHTNPIISWGGGGGGGQVRLLSFEKGQPLTCGGGAILDSRGRAHM